MKNLTKMGVLLFIVSLFVIYLSTQSIQSTITGGSVQELSILPYNTIYDAFSLPNATAVGFVYYTSANAVNFALFNQSGFDSYFHEMNSSKPNATLIDGKGTLDFVYNGSYGIFPYQQRNATSAQAYYNSSVILPPGNYYAVFYNPNPLSVMVAYSLIAKPTSQLDGAILSSAAYGVSGALLFFGGIVVVLYSIFLSPKNNAPQLPPAADVHSKPASGPIGSRKRAKGRKRKANK